MITHLDKLGAFLKNAPDKKVSGHCDPAFKHAVLISPQCWRTHLSGTSEESIVERSQKPPKKKRKRKASENVVLSLDSLN